MTLKWLLPSNQLNLPLKLFLLDQSRCLRSTEMPMPEPQQVELIKMRQEMLSSTMKSLLTTKLILRRSQTQKTTPTKIKEPKLLQTMPKMMKATITKTRRLTHRMIKTRVTVLRRRKTRLCQRTKMMRLKMRTKNKVTQALGKKMNKMMMKVPRKEMAKMLMKTWKMMEAGTPERIKDRAKIKTSKMNRMEETKNKTKKK